MAFLVMLLGCKDPLPPGDPARPDIVLISVDSLRADHLSSYGYNRKTSPFFDDLAEDGLRFAEARSSSPWTLPSHMTMLTGLLPTEHQVVEDNLKLSAAIPMVQEALQKSGYATAGIVSTIYVSKMYGFSRGFDLFEDFGITEDTNLHHTTNAQLVVDKALGWAAALPEKKPAFLFIHLYDVHYPYKPPEPYDTRFDHAGDPEQLKYRTYQYYQDNPVKKKRMEHLQAQYDEAILYVNDQLERIYDAWERSDRQAYWIITADHGEEFGERGSWGHAHTLYPEQLHVPLIVAGPGIKPAVRTDPGATRDIAPTIAAMAGLSWDGADLRQPVPARPHIAETSRFKTARLSYEEGDFRLDVDLSKGARELYDHREDPLEKKNLWDATSSDALALEQRLLQALGLGWVVDAGVEVQTPGYLWTAAGWVKPPLPGPVSFGVFPLDARVMAGPVSVKGIAEAPTEGPLRYTGPRRAVSQKVEEDTRAMLEALGYVGE